MATKKISVLAEFIQCQVKERQSLACHDTLYPRAFALIGGEGG